MLIVGHVIFKLSAKKLTPLHYKIIQKVLKLYPNLLYICFKWFYRVNSDVLVNVCSCIRILFFSISDYLEYYILLRHA